MTANKKVTVKLSSPQYRLQTFGGKKEEENPFDFREGEVGRQFKPTKQPWHLGGGDGSALLTMAVLFVNVLGNVVRVITIPFRKGDDPPDSDSMDMGAQNN